MPILLTCAIRNVFQLLHAAIASSRAFDYFGHLPISISYVCDFFEVGLNANLFFCLNYYFIFRTFLVARMNTLNSKGVILVQLTVINRSVLYVYLLKLSELLYEFRIETSITHIHITPKNL